MGRLKTALVLGAGAARGAYEAGVVAWLREELEPQLGTPLPIDVVAGTSVGAVHACYLAATMDTPARQGAGLIAQWEAMRVEQVLRFGYGDVWRLLRESFGRAPRSAGRDLRFGGLVDPAGLRALVGQKVPWTRIGRNLRKGVLDALAISTTHVGTGRTRVYVQRRGGGLPPWTADPQVEGIAARIGPNHALASAAIPVLFPAVRVRGELHADGALRMSVPLSPALRLGAQRVVVISPSRRDPPPNKVTRELHEAAYGSAAYLAGKMLVALLADRTDQDLARVEQINNLLNAGVESYGEGFLKMLQQTRSDASAPPFHYVRTLMVRPSADLGAMAAEYIQTREFREGGEGLAHRAILKLVEREAPGEADLASHLLFDRGFAARLIELGRNDARAQREDWLRFFSDEPQCAAEAANFERPADAVGSGRTAVG
jgi:NTE family protein